MANYNNRFLELPSYIPLERPLFGLHLVIFQWISPCPNTGLEMSWRQTPSFSSLLSAWCYWVGCWIKP